MTIISENVLTELYGESLDLQGEITVAGQKFLPSVILFECDPIAWRTGLSDFANSLSEDGYLVEGYND